MGNEKNPEEIEANNQNLPQQSRRELLTLVGRLILIELSLLALALIFSAPLWIWLAILSIPFLFIFILGIPGLLGFSHLLNLLLKISRKISEANKFPPHRWNYLEAGLGLGLVWAVLASTTIPLFIDSGMRIFLREFIVLTISALIPLLLIIGGIGYAYTKEWGRRLLDIVLLYCFLAGSLALGLWLAATLREIPQNNAPFLITGIITLFINLIWLSFFLQWRMGLWQPQLLAAFGKDSGKIMPRKILLKTAVTGLGIFILAFACLTLWINYHTR